LTRSKDLNDISNFKNRNEKRKKKKKSNRSGKNKEDFKEEHKKKQRVNQVIKTTRSEKCLIMKDFMMCQMNFRRLMKINICFQMKEVKGKT